MAKKKNKPGFEQMVAELEAIVETLERDQPELEEAIAVYERGMELAKRCQAILDQAQRKVQLLREGEGGEVVSEPLDPAEGES